MKIKLHLENGDEPEITCYKTNSPCFVVNRTIFVRTLVDCWTVTHVPSTYAIFTRIPSRKLAIDVANLLAEKVTGWENVTKETIAEKAPIMFKQNFDVLKAIQAYAHEKGPRPQ